MKRHFLYLAILLVSAVGLVRTVGSLRAETLSVPTDNTGNALQFSDYGGYAYSTGTFSTQMVTATYVGNSTITIGGSGVAAYVVFSTGNQTSYDFVEMFDATATAHSGPAITRVYNNNFEVASSTVVAGIRKVGPIRFKRGLLWRCSSSLYNLITVLYNKN